jgi:hypothetical protein
MSFLPPYNKEALLTVRMQTNLDIEVAVRGNSVDIGIFSRTEFFEREELGEIIEELCETVAEM